MKRLFVLLSCVLMLGACATVGNRALEDPDKVMSSLIVNQTTMAQVTALLGDANEEEADPEHKGDRIWTYLLAKSTSYIVTTSTTVTRLFLRFHNGVLVEKTLKRPQY